MDHSNELKVRQVTFKSHDRAAICCSLVGTTIEELLEEINVILPKQPDVLEWRADFFSNLHNQEAVIQVANVLRKEIGETALLFTIRSEREGGQPITLTDLEQEQLMVALVQDHSIDLLDLEWASPFSRNQKLIELARSHQIKLIFSTHFFSYTPREEKMRELLKQGQTGGADIVKLAVMPTNEQDVLSLLQVTTKAAATLAVPIITIAMGKLGLSSRLIGDQFGSVMTFAIGAQASAPGQIPIEVIRDVQKYTHT